MKTLASDYTNNVYLVPSEKARFTDMTYKETWHTFDEYKEKNFAFWKVVLPRTVWKKGMCNCPQFFKIYVCKHIIGLAIRLKLATPPLEAKLIPIGQKRKRGRPAKSKPALIIQ